MRSVTLADRLERVCGRELGDRALRVELLAEIRREIPCEAYAWVLTDPETEVGTSPLAEVPSLDDLPALIRLKYLTPVNRWTALGAAEAVTLVGATRGERRSSPMWAGLLAGYGFDDVLSTVFRDPFGCWGFLDLWRRGGSFSERERETLSEVARDVTPAVRRSLSATFEPSPWRPEPRPEPVVVLVADDLRPRTQTAATDAQLRTLLPTEQDRAPVPAVVLNAAAQLLALDAGVDPHPPWARVARATGGWCTVRAARLADEGPAPQQEAIAVSIEASTPHERSSIFARVFGLSPRETDLLDELVTGADTRTAAAELNVSEHTVQDHLKSIFAKTGVRSRPALIARATGAA